MGRAVSEAVRRAAELLATSGSASPHAEARTLVAHVSGVEPGRLPIAPDLTDAQLEALEAALTRRCAGEPLQHITGVAWFRTTSLTVGAGVFVPRPETETMTGWCLEHLGAGQRVVELCAGSGAISKALSVEGGGYEQWAVEMSPDAVSYLVGNLADTDVRVVEGDMADAVHELDGTVDLVVVNPPYVPLDAWESVPADVRDHDPELAVFSGDDGLDAMHVVARVAARLLKPSGLLAAEHAEVQHEQVVELFARHGSYDTVRDNKDLVGRWRFVTARRRG
jgi:release factor glutamine methyltransferase